MAAKPRPFGRVDRKAGSKKPSLEALSGAQGRQEWAGACVMGRGRRSVLGESDSVEIQMQGPWPQAQRRFSSCGWDQKFPFNLCPQ